MMIEHLMIVVLAVMYLRLHYDYRVIDGAAKLLAKNIVLIAHGRAVAVRKDGTVKIEEKK